MKLSVSLFLLTFNLVAVPLQAAQPSYWCEGTAQVEGFSRPTDILVDLDSSLKLLQLYDFSNDLEEWLSYKVEMRRAERTYKVFEASLEARDLPRNVPPTYSILTFELRSENPVRIYNFAGRVGKYKIRSTVLECKYK